MVAATAPGQLDFDDGSHSYHLAGPRCANISSLAKIITNNFALDAYGYRKVIEGLTKDPELRERAAAAIGNNDALARVADDAKRAAGAYLGADRGVLMHWVLQQVLLGRTDLLLTDRQRADADALRRTLDLYRLTPTRWVESIVVYPEHLVAGRLDAVLEKPDGTTILVDLKSGENAVKYPQGTAVQLALYQRAPFVAASVQTNGDKSTVTEWGSLPENLYLPRAYVLLLQPGEPVGALYAINTEHGWTAAQLALRIVQWRRAFNYGRGLAHEVKLPRGQREG
jgi:hypothetical protein